MKKIAIILGVIGLVALVWYVVSSSHSPRVVITTPPSPDPTRIPEPVIVPEEGEVAVVVVPNISSSGNDKIGKVTVGEESSGDGMQIRKHTYSVVTSKEQLDALENTLTYVVLPRNLSQSSNPNRAVNQRYRQVLELIQELRQVSNNKNQPKSAMRKFENQFILFRDKEGLGKVTIENYDYALAHGVLDFFQEKYPEVALSQEGPYLITTARNVLNEQKDFSFMYINLSTFNNSSVKEVIESYKKRLIHKGNSEVETLEKWRLNLLSALTNLNDDIHIVQTAVAGDL